MRTIVKIFLMLLLPISIAYLSIHYPNLSPLRGGGDTFENIHPEVNSRLTIKEIENVLERESVTPKIKQEDSFTKITGKKVLSRGWYPTVDYFLGKGLSSEFLSSIGFPNDLSQELKFNNDTLIAVKIFHPDLTSTGKTALRRVLESDEKLDFQEENDGNYLFQYNDYLVVLNGNTIYMYLNK